MTKIPQFLKALMMFSLNFVRAVLCLKGTSSSLQASIATLPAMRAGVDEPERAGRLAEAVVAGIPYEVLAEVDIVVSPAMGGIIIGHEVARVLGKDALFLERPEGVFHLRRGFALEARAKVLMVEDVVTTAFPAARRLPRSRAKAARSSRNAR